MHLLKGDSHCVGWIGFDATVLWRAARDADVATTVMVAPSRLNKLAKRMTAKWIGFG